MGARVLIVDAHSVIFAWPELITLHQRRMSLARDELIKLLTQFHDTADFRVVVVFDGKGERLAEETEPGGIQIFYASEAQTADDVIERLVAKYATTYDITVATADRLEQQTVSSFGASCLSPEMLKTELAVAADNFARQLKLRRHKR